MQVKQENSLNCFICRFQVTNDWIFAVYRKKELEKNYELRYRNFFMEITEGIQHRQPVTEHEESIFTNSIIYKVSENTEVLLVFSLTDKTFYVATLKDGKLKCGRLECLVKINQKKLTCN